MATKNSTTREAYDPSSDDDKNEFEHTDPKEFKNLVHKNQTKRIRDEEKKVWKKAIDSEKRAGDRYCKRLNKRTGKRIHMELIYHDRKKLNIKGYCKEHFYEWRTKQKKAEKKLRTEAPNDRPRDPNNNNNNDLGNPPDAKLKPKAPELDLDFQRALLQSFADTIFQQLRTIVPTGTAPPPSSNPSPAIGNLGTAPPPTNPTTPGARGPPLSAAAREALQTIKRNNELARQREQEEQQRQQPVDPSVDPSWHEFLAESQQGDESTLSEEEQALINRAQQRLGTRTRDAEHHSRNASPSVSPQSAAARRYAEEQALFREYEEYRLAQELLEEARLRGERIRQEQEAARSQVRSPLLQQPERPRTPPMDRRREPSYESDISRASMNTISGPGAIREQPEHSSSEDSLSSIPIAPEDDGQDTDMEEAHSTDREDSEIDLVGSDGDVNQALSATFLDGLKKKHQDQI